MDKPEKNSEIDLIAGQLSGAQIALCADYRGLTVAEITELRKALRESGAVGRVVKNTLAKISCQKAFNESDTAELEKLLKLFEGPSMLVVSEDNAVSPAKAITKFQKEHKQLEVKGGWFEGAFIDVDGVKAISAMPSREELLAKLLSILNAPATKLVQFLKEPGNQVVRLLDAQRQEIEKKG